MQICFRASARPRAELLIFSMLAGRKERLALAECLGSYPRQPQRARSFWLSGKVSMSVEVGGIQLVWKGCQCKKLSGEHAKTTGWTSDTATDSAAGAESKCPPARKTPRVAVRFSQSTAQARLYRSHKSHTSTSADDIKR